MVLESSLVGNLWHRSGDVRRFERKQSLVAFAGIDSMLNQAGDKIVKSGKYSKRGPISLQNPIQCHGDILVMCSPVLSFSHRPRNRTGRQSLT